ncbi:MAG: metallophosphoesterase [Bradymonadaceae bacterium]
MATGVGLVAAGTYVYATHVEPEMVRVRRHTLPVENVEERVRIVHLSDIQTIDVGQRERRIFERIRRIDPDLVVHTGDVLAHPTRRELREVADMFATLDPPGGVLNVDGDADRALTDAEWEWFDRRAGTETLLDRRRTVRVGGTRIDVLGLSGLGSRTVERPAVDEWLESVDPADRHVHLVIGHAPDYMLELRGADIDLALAGHTHGGQIRIPFYGPPVTLSEVPRSWARGVTRVDGTYLNVSAGIGAERAQGLPPIRINCPPEFSVIDLVPAEGG